jgi:hypothetical protein
MEIRLSTTNDGRHLLRKFYFYLVENDGKHKKRAKATRPLKMNILLLLAVMG